MYGTKKRIKAKTLKEFEDEHMVWSNLIHLCERNKETVYEYGGEFVDFVEEDIICDGEPYEVIILKSDLPTQAGILPMTEMQAMFIRQD